MRNRITLFALSLLLCFTAVAGAQIVAAPGFDNRIIPDQYIIGWKPTVAKAARMSRVQAARGEVLHDFHLWPATSVKMSQQDAERMKLDPSVRYVVPDQVVKLMTSPNDTYYGDQWHLKNPGGLLDHYFYDAFFGATFYSTAGIDINAENAWTITTGDSTLLIGLIDTGVDYNHPDLVNNIWTNPGETPGNGIDDDDNGYIDDVHGTPVGAGKMYSTDTDVMDHNGHGTHCAGLIAAVGNNGIGVHGVMRQANIVTVRAFSACGEGSSSSFAEAVEYCITVGCKLTSNSYGSPTFYAPTFPNNHDYDPIWSGFKDATDAAQAAGQLYVVAAGNGFTDLGDTTLIEMPAEDTNPITLVVGAMGSRNDRPPFTNFGAPWVDVAAPGSSITSTWSTDVNLPYRYASGTSMATPIVAGICGLVWSKYPYLSWQQVKAMVMSGVVAPTYSDPNRGQGGGHEEGWDWLSSAVDGNPKTVGGGGRVDAYLALTQPKGAISQSDITGGLILTGTSSGTPGLSYSCTIRDSGGVPVPNVSVVFDFTGADSVLVCDNAQYSCATKKAIATTDNDGVANFYLAGKVLDCDGALATLTVDGAGWGGKPVCAMDVNSNGVIDGGDLSGFTAQPSGCVKHDMNGSGGDDGDDLSVFLDHYFGDGTGGCSSPDTLCASTLIAGDNRSRAEIERLSRVATLQFIGVSGKGSARFVLTLPQAAVVDGRLYDTAGREVARIAEGTKEPGAYAFQVGAGIPTGVYFGRMTVTSGGAREVLQSKVVVVK